MVSEATATVLGHDKDINALAVSPNDALLASASQVSDRSRLHDWFACDADGGLMRSVCGLARWLQDKTVKLWDAKDLSPRGVLKGHRRGVWSIDFSPIDR